MIDKRINSLRVKMQQLGLSAYIIPSSDPHMSEYLPDYWECRQWISGFSGSAGLVVVTLSKSGLWTDSRYFLQAEEELSGTEIKLHKVFDRSNAVYIEYICEELSAGEKIGVSPALFSKFQIERFRRKIKAAEIEIVMTDDLFESVWADRPPLPGDQVFRHDIKYTGESRSAKIDRVRNKMKSANATHYVVSTLDDVAWLFNLRGSDTSKNPLFISYAVVEKDKSILFINKNKVSKEIEEELLSQNVQLEDYNSIRGYLENLKSEDAILIHSGTLNYKLYSAINEAKIIEGQNIVGQFKAVKNKTELENFDTAMLKDGLALSEAFYWLENTLTERTVKEYEFSEKLNACRGKQADHYGESFSSIVGYKSNGAIIHYRPDAENSSAIGPEGSLLVDSGGQYIDGTTDITRTFYFGDPSSDFVDSYTRVLKGYIALERARFPKETTGGQLDILARKSLWEVNKNYGHGTGHGVGFFLCVHEGPQGISSSKSLGARTEFEAGMVTSNEPGYYVEGSYGIRIENVIVCKEADAEGFLYFEPITLFPIETKAIKRDLLDETEIQWLNDYHKKVYKTLSPHLEDPIKKWLQQKCQSL